MIKKVQTTDQNLSRVQDNVDDFLRQQKRMNPLQDGILLEGVSIGTNDTRVNHSLQRKTKGYIVVNRDSNSLIYTSSTANPRPEDQLILKASASVVASLWIF